MYIDKELCIKCHNCIPVCPMSAISKDDEGHAKIYPEDCVECGTCKRVEICPENAIKQVDELPYPRDLRAAFSDPMYTHESTKIQGRGTEEMKTNDVTEKFERGRIGLCIELGRPGAGAYFSDVEKVTKKLASIGVEFSEDNPVFYLLDDREKGSLRSEILDEKVLSAIVECLIPEGRAIDIVEEMINFLEGEIETVASIGLIVRADESGNIPIMNDLESSEISLYPNGKVNIGMTIAGRKE